MWNWRIIPEQFTPWADIFTDEIAGSSIPARTAMIEITTSSSIKVKARFMGIRPQS
jgi:hypothetical protein